MELSSVFLADLFHVQVLNTDPSDSEQERVAKKPHLGSSTSTTTLTLPTLPSLPSPTKVQKKVSNANAFPYQPTQPMPTSRFSSAFSIRRKYDELCRSCWDENIDPHSHEGEQSDRKKAIFCSQGFFVEAAASIFFPEQNNKGSFKRHLNRFRWQIVTSFHENVVK